MATATSSNTVEEAATLIRERIRELDGERAQLQRALASLTGGREGRRGPGRPQGSSNSTATRTRGRRRRGRRNTRADQAVKLVEASPGISASEIARKMHIKPNYLYRVLAELQKDGRVRKDGRAYHPAK
jgi:DNA invertase Pin-like site-specific DNA recombinase